MKRRFTILTAALALLTFLAVPMGMWGQASVTLTQSSLGLTGSYTTNTQKTIDGITYVYTDLMKNSDNIQARASTGTIKNSTAYSGDIISVTITHSGTARATTINGSANGTDWVQVATGSGSITADFSGKGYKYFQITRGSNAAYWTQIVITYSNGGTPTYTLTSAVTPTGTGTVALSDTSLEEGETATATATANAHYTFTSWSIAGEGATLSSTTSNPTTVTIGTANAIITATFTEDPKYNITYNANYAGSTDEPVVVSDYAGETMTIADYSTFSRTGYAITNWNTQADGTGTSYNAGDSYTMTSAGLTLYAQWEVSYEVVDYLDREFTGVSDGATSYSTWKNKIGTSGAVYAGNSAGSNNSIQLRTNASAAGIVTTATAGKVTKVQVEWNTNTASGRRIRIYGKNSPYSAASDLHSTNTATCGTLIGTIDYGSSTTEISINNNYEYIGVRADNGALYLNWVKITWSTTPSTVPSITADNVNIPYDATSGSIAYTINNEPDPAGTLTASVPQNSWLTLGTVGATVPFTCTANPTSAARTETVTLTYTYNTRETVTKEVSVTQAGNPNIVDNISAITTVGNQYTVRGTVVATNSRGFIIGDGTGYIYTYLGSDPSWGVDDMVTLSGTMGNHNNVLQFTSSATVTAATSSNYDGTPAVTVITEIPDYTQDNHLSTYLQFEGELTKSSINYFIAVGEDDIQISYPTTAQTTTLDGLDGKKVRVKGYFAAYNSSNHFTVMMESVEEVTDPYITIESDAFELTANEEEGYLEITYGNFTPISFDIMFCDANGDALAGDDPDWIMFGIEAPEGETGDFVYYLTEANEGPARTAYFKVYASLGEGLENVYSNLVTVTQAEYEAPSSWVLTDLADLTPADVFVIVGDNTKTYALPSTGTGSSPTATEISVNTLNEPYTLENAPEASLQWNLIHTEDGYVFYPYGETTIWLNCTNSNDGVRVSNSSSNAKHFTLSDNGYLTTTETTNQRYLGIYNSRDWRTYENTTGNIANQSFSFYKKVTDPVTYTKDDIAAYVGEKDNYYLIASPVASVTPSASNGFLTNDYDLYYFDDSQDKEWINHEAGAFNLVSGKGYLYANNGENVTLTFTGAPYFGNGLVPLQYTDDARFAGWNLIGNPFNTNATLNMPYYRLNADGSGLSTTTENTAVNVMEGVFVQATAANAEAVFTQASSGAKSISQLNLKVTRNRGNVVDNAIIRFDEGATLGKFQLNENSTKVYFTQNDKDFAVVRSNSEGEMPVSFKAAENGNYTFSVEPESLEVSYLHLIDNLTGTDVDLLATPSYSFEARTTDYANRFRLEFNTNGVEENNATANFAYFNGSSWTVNNMGEATLQVVDVMGRVLSTETISGNTEVNLNQAAGVYMLRLVTGNDVKVQKVVVR